MVTLTETQIDLADQHTTLYHLGWGKSVSAKGGPKSTAGGATGQRPMPFGSEEEYCLLHRTLADTPTAFSQVRGIPGVILGNLNPVYVTQRLDQGYRSNKYWRRLIGSGDPESYPDNAWRCILPIEARLTSVIGFVGKAGWSFNVQPVPRVLLYPFGWSAWISLRIVGPHSVDDLADVVQSVFQGAPFQPEGGASPLTLDQFFDLVAAGVRVDAFGEGLTRDVSSPDVVVVTTVLAKHGGSPSLGALSTTDKVTMRRLVHPSGPPPGSPFAQHVRPLVPENDPRSGLEYVLKEDMKRFIWLEHLLAPVGKNRVWLRCYHNNTFRALVHAGHLRAFLETFMSTKPRATSLKQLASAALDSLASPRYSNASLKDYRADPAVDKLVQNLQQQPIT